MKHAIWALAALTVLGCHKKDAATSTTGPIKLGQTIAYSGPASAYGVIGKAQTACFRMLNEEKGGVNGRKVELVSLDDGYNPAKTVEQTRKLVESEDILADVGCVGTASVGSVHAYLNEKKIPQIFPATGAEKWADPKFPWTVGWQPSYRAEGKIYGKYIDQAKPGAKACVLYQNDDFGKDIYAGVKDTFASDPGRIVKAASYEVTDPTVDSQIVTLQASGCEAVVLGASPKFAAQAIRKIYDIGWKPLELVSNVSVSVTTVFKPAGLEKSTGIVTGSYLKDPSDPTFANDKGVADYRAFMKKYLPDTDPNDSNAVWGYGIALTTAKVLEQCGSEVTRENIMKQALSLDHLQLPILLPGIDVTTGPNDFHPITKLQLARFNGTSLERFGDILSSE